MSKKDRPIWYGTKTFKILEGFNHQGIYKKAGDLFTCDRETHGDYKKFLGSEYVAKTNEESKQEKVDEAKRLKADGNESQNGTKENAGAEGTAQPTTDNRNLGHKIRNEEERKKLSDAGMTEEDINRDDKGGMFIKPDSKYFPKKSGIFNKLFKK